MPRKSHGLKKRRAVTDIISTMLLMGVTISGSTALAYFMNDAFLTGNLGTVETLDSATQSIQLLGYDTRDSTSLFGIVNLDNNFSTTGLCGASCNFNPDFIPNNGGTDFIVIQIQNNSINTLFLHAITLNDVEYLWDAGTSNEILNTSSDYLSPTNRPYPSNGMFSIVSTEGPSYIQSLNKEIPSGDSVNLLIKLDDQQPDISLNNGIRVQFNFGTLNSPDFVIDSGGIR